MQGQFWLADSPTKVVAGEYVADEGVLRIRGEEFVSCMVVVSSGRDYVERTWRDDRDASYRIHGKLADGTAVTLPFAHRGRCVHNREILQEFMFLQALEGGHVGDDVAVSGAQATYAGFDRWAWTGPVEFFPGATGRLDGSGDQVRFTGLPDLRIEEVERFVLGPLNSLFTLLTAARTVPATLRVTTDAGTELLVRRRARDMAANPSSDLWLNPSQLGTASLQAWYALSNQLTPLPTALAKTIAAEGLDVEVRILTLAAAAEAIHRTLHDEKVMTKDQASRIRKAAVEAVPAEARARVEAMLGGLRDMSFGDRLLNLAGRLGLHGYEICGPEVFDVKTRQLSKKVGRGAWLESLKQARNGFAHQSRRSPGQLRRYALEMQVLYETLRWATTAWLLLELDLPPDEIVAAMRRSSAYERFRLRLLDTWPEVVAPSWSSLALP